MLNNPPQDPSAVGVTREDLEETLDANGYYRGKVDEDPDKDATHIWYSSDNRRYVKFTIPKEDGQVLYGDAQSGDAYITYNNCLLVLSGLMTLSEAKKPKFALPANVAAKLTAARAASTAAALPGPAAAEAALALPEGQYAADVTLGDPAKETVESPVSGDDGVFAPHKGDKGVF